MTRKEQIIDDISKLEVLLADASGNVPENIKKNAASKIEKLKKEMDELGDEGEVDSSSGQGDDNPPSPTPAPTPSVSKKQAKSQPPASKSSQEGEPDLRTALIVAIKELMDMKPGSGVDSVQVQGIITQYLSENKISLELLDRKVLEEIKRNQTVMLELPQFGLQIEVDKSVSEIPNIYSILDDVLSGNNVFLIGEAGGGKTFTAEKVAEILKRSVMIINCSQYTSPVEILGGQTIDGYKDGKLVVAWRDGRILILDEMPKLDSNTAGLFNDALAKSSKTRLAQYAKISTANPEEPPVPRNDNFGLIATGNLYPNKPPVGGYVGNNQQDLSLLDRFSGSVYFVEFSKYIDEESCRYSLLYNFLVGNYHEYIDALRNNRPLPEAVGLRTVIEKNNYKNMALMSYRTIIAFRVAFEIELVRAIQRKKGQSVLAKGGKTVRQTYENYLVAFAEDARQSIIRSVGSPEELEGKVKKLIDQMSDGGENVFTNALTLAVKEVAGAIYKNAQGWTIAENYKSE